jgi:MYXO-CTERM domain-containing protein
LVTATLRAPRSVFVCVVAITGPAVTCGNNSVDEGETCDDGNRTDGDGCSANCVDETGGDGGGCCSADGGPAGAFALTVVTFGLAFGRRRRRN